MDARRRGAALLAALLLVPACAPLSEPEQAGVDQEVTRDILWAYHQDPAGRFSEVSVTCVDRQIVLAGRVDSIAAAQDAFKIARGRARGAAVSSRLQVHPK
jgi:osmotically-inducible protein OsmY